MLIFTNLNYCFNLPPMGRGYNCYEIAALFMIPDTYIKYHYCPTKTMRFFFALEYCILDMGSY